MEKKLGSAALRACLTCGGVWLDPVACKKLTEQAGTSYLMLADGNAKQATVHPDEPTALCPVCRVPMQRTPVPDVEVSIDTCRHGTWFDANELRIFVGSLKPAVTSGPMAPLPPAARASRRATTSADADDSVVEVVGTFIEGTGGILELLSLFE